MTATMTAAGGFPTAQDWTLACRDLWVRRGEHVALRNVTLEIRAGECVSIVGPNGAGKTTLLKALLGLLSATRGRVLLNDAALRSLSARARGRFAAYVPQSLTSVPSLSAWDVVAAARHPYLPPLGPLSSTDRAAVQSALETCGVAGFAPRTLDSLSGGERQKVLLAAAIAQDPQVLMLDEPTTALDPTYQVAFARILRDWHAAGRAVVIVSHDLQLPAALGGRVIALRDSEVVADGPAATLLEPGQLAAVFGGSFIEATTADGRRLTIPHWWTG